MARKKPAPPPAPGRIARLAGAAVARPAATGGGILMLAVAAVILTNALALQPGAHPAPLFKDTRPVPPGAIAPATAGPVAEEVDSIDDLVRRTTGRAEPAIDSGLVREIQEELKARGYYLGEVDGLTGPMTSAAILRFEEEEGLRATGEPTGDVLAALRAGRPDRRSEVVEPQPAPAHVPPPPPRPAELRPMTAAAEPAPAAMPALAGSGDTLQATPAVLRSEPAPAPPPAASDPRLARVQEALDLLGYGPLSPDGQWTPETRAAIRRFEENRGLVVTGEINEAFVAELVRIGGLALD